MRERIVSRTISTTVYTVLAITVSTNTVSQPELTLSSVPENIKPDKLMSLLKKNYETEDLKLVSVLASRTVLKRYGMAEDEFIKLAKELPLLPNATDDSATESEAETVPETHEKSSKRTGNKKTSKK